MRTDVARTTINKTRVMLWVDPFASPHRLVSRMWMLASREEVEFLSAKVASQSMPVDRSHFPERVSVEFPEELV